MGQVGIGSYEQVVMAGHMSIEDIRAFILKALMPQVFIRTFPSSLIRVPIKFKTSQIATYMADLITKINVSQGISRIV